MIRWRNSGSFRKILTKLAFLVDPLKKFAFTSRSFQKMWGFLWRFDEIRFFSSPSDKINVTITILDE